MAVAQGTKTTRRSTTEKGTAQRATTRRTSTQRGTTQRTTTRRASAQRATTARPAAETSTRRRTTARKRAGEETAERTTHRTATLPVPVVTPHLSVRKVRIPAPAGLPVTGHEVVEAGRVATSHLPPPDRLAYYAGLGALAVFGVVEWPVAAAIAVGVGIARRARSGNGARRESAKKE
ncbi:hypothetical protein ACFY4C_36340 [Actinomadura viridis]|uniref:hypothetical protein n=1 Tax=Actinomadura viridis TaxID=58110 RepID=UPI00368FE355